jgi:hypothetical protein
MKLHALSSYKVKIFHKLNLTELLHNGLHNLTELLHNGLHNFKKALRLSFTCT